MVKMTLILVVVTTIATGIGFAIEFFNVEAKLQGALGFNPQYGLMALVLVLNALVIQWMAFQGINLLMD